MVVWLYGCMVVWLYGCMVVWLYGCMVVWLYGYMVVWLYGCMVVWLYGCMVVWLYGCMVVWLYGCMAIFLGIFQKKCTNDHLKDEIMYFLFCNYLAPSPKGEFLCKFAFKLAYQNTKIGENWR